MSNKSPEGRESSVTKYRAAIIGCGGRAAWHTKAYRSVDRAALVACCDLITERRERFALEFGLRSYADADTMLAQEKPDLVHIVTLPTVRVPLLQIVSDRGVPGCIVEKPIAWEVRDWKAIGQIESSSKTRFGVGAQFRYHPTLVRCREALRSGRLGKLLFLDASARGTICDQGVHTLDWAMSLNEDVAPVSVFGGASGAQEMSGRQPSPDTAAAQVLFANGVRMLWHLGHSAPRTLDDPAYYKHCRVAAYAERGHTLYEEFAGWEIVSSTGTQAGRVASAEDWTEGNHTAQANLTNAMLDWLEDGERPVGTNLKRALAQWNVVLGLYASVVTHRPVDLPCDPPDDLLERLQQMLQ